MSEIKSIIKILDNLEDITREVKTKEFDNVITSNGDSYDLKSNLHNKLLRPQKYQNLFALSDNLEFMKYIIDINNKLKKKNLCQFIYGDPPFFSNADYNATIPVKNNKGEKQNIKILAYEDKWAKDLNVYLGKLAVSMKLMKDLLADNGVIAIHLDYRAASYAKILLDEIFGSKNFVNEIIWQYKSGGSNKRTFSKKHDNIIIYAKNKDYKFNIQKEKSYNRGLKPYYFKGVKEFQDEIGWYTLVNMKDVWDIDMVGRTSKERNGYATQKPQALLKRLINTFTDEGDLVGDFFGGSGVTLKAANDLNRRYIGCDISTLSCSYMLENALISGNDFIFLKERDKTLSQPIENILQVDDYEFIMDIANSNPEKLIKYTFEDKNCKGGQLEELIVDIFGNFTKTIK